MLKVIASSLPRLPVRSRIYSRKMTTASPICPKFVPVEQLEITPISKLEGFKFSLVSYNILAQAYAKSEQFPHSPSPCRKWKARSGAILTLLKGLGADIICLQEVDEYENFYKGNMESHGYTSIYVQRSGKKPDGCGIFYNQIKAELVLEEKIEYNDLVSSIQEGTTLGADKDSDTLASGNKDVEEHKGLQKKENDSSRGDTNDPRVRLKRDCVAIMAAFKLKDPSNHVVIVANTHLYWDPKLADVKLAQARYLLERLAQFKTLVSDKFECLPSVIVAGDFNSVPQDKVYRYMISGNSGIAESDACLEDLPMPLCSVYASTMGEPPFTNCTPDFTDTLDYIFFSPNGDIKPVSYLELPKPGSPSVANGLPNYHHPSDHLPIGAEFEVVGN